MFEKSIYIHPRLKEDQVMLNWLMRKLEVIGIPAGWIVAITQLIIWVIGFPILWLRERKLRKNRQQDQGLIQNLREELAEVKDKANEWEQMTKQAVLMMRARCKKAFKEFTDYYGGEDKFAHWWYVP